MLAGPKIARHEMNIPAQRALTTDEYVGAAMRLMRGEPTKTVGSVHGICARRLDCIHSDRIPGPHGSNEMLDTLPLPMTRNAQAPHPASIGQFARVVSDDGHASTSRSISRISPTTRLRSASISSSGRGGTYW